MSNELLLTIGMFGGLVLAIMSGVSLGFAMGGIAVVSALIMWGPGGLMPIVAGVFNYMWMLLLAAVPLFIFIGVALSKSGIAVDMYETFYLWSGSLRGGLAIGSCGFAAALSAMTGNCSASTVTTGLVGMPPMRSKGYKDSIIFGTIGSAGTLGILIPPSITLIVIGMMTGQSIGKLFAGGLMAGLFILLGFCAYILILSWLRPEICPAIQESVNLRRKMRSLKSVMLPVLIMLAILGTIFFGVATPTEAASVGALAVVLAVIVRGEFNWAFIKEVSYSTATVTGMVLWIMFGASGFVAVYSGGGGVFFVQQLLAGTDLSPWTLFILMNLFVFILGMFLDPMGIILLCLPIFYPIIQRLGFDPIWFGVIFQVNLCMGYLTPPFGYNLFYLKSLAPEAEMKLIYKSVMPFIGIMILCTIVMIIFPEIIVWLPNVLLGR
jgi:tripartite ATP-independent transporter DctM subunit